MGEGDGVRPGDEDERVAPVQECAVGGRRQRGAHRQVEHCPRVRLRKRGDDADRSGGVGHAAAIVGGNDVDVVPAWQYPRQPTGEDRAFPSEVCPAFAGLGIDRQQVVDACRYRVRVDQRALFICGDEPRQPGRQRGGARPAMRTHDADHPPAPGQANGRHEFEHVG